MAPFRDRKRHFWTLFPGLLMALTGCFATSPMTTARTLDEGNSQWFVAVYGVAPQRLLADTLSLPKVEIGSRYGLSDDVELGTRLYFSVGAALDLKIQLVRWEDEG